MKPQIPDEIRDKLDNLLEYNWNEELRDYKECDDEVRERHIFRDLVDLSNWLNGTNFTVEEREHEND